MAGAFPTGCRLAEAAARVLLNCYIRNENASSAIDPTSLAMDGCLAALLKVTLGFAFARYQIDLLGRDPRNVEVNWRHCRGHSEAEVNAERRGPDAARSLDPRIVRNMAADEIDAVDLLILWFGRSAF